METDKKWYVIKVYSNREKKCFEDLTKLGVEVYFPLQKVVKKWSDRNKIVEVPLFRGYLFVKIDYNNRASIYQSNHFKNFLINNGKPGVVSEKEIDLINKILTNSSDIETDNKSLQEGRLIKINSGPFEGYEGYITSFKDVEKIKISIPLINQNISLVLQNIEFTFNEL